MHEGRGRWVGSNKLVELNKRKKPQGRGPGRSLVSPAAGGREGHSGRPEDAGRQLRSVQHLLSPEDRLFLAGARKGVGSPAAWWAERSPGGSRPGPAAGPWGAPGGSRGPCVWLSPRVGFIPPRPLPRASSACQALFGVWAECVREPLPGQAGLLRSCHDSRVRVQEARGVAEVGFGPGVSNQVRGGTCRAHPSQRTRTPRLEEWLQGGSPGLCRWDSSPC